MNEWVVIAMLFGLALLAAGLGALCDRLDRKPGGPGPTGGRAS